MLKAQRISQQLLLYFIMKKLQLIILILSSDIIIEYYSIRWVRDNLLVSFILRHTTYNMKPKPLMLIVCLLCPLGHLAAEICPILLYRINSVAFSKRKIEKRKKKRERTVSLKKSTSVPLRHKYWHCWLHHIWFNAQCSPILFTPL